MVAVKTDGRMLEEAARKQDHSRGESKGPRTHCHSRVDCATLRGGAGGATGANHSVLPLKVSAMKWGLLPVSHNALLVGDMAYYNFNGEMEQEADRINLQKCLGPTCKVWLSCSRKMFQGGLSKADVTRDTCSSDDV